MNKETLKFCKDELTRLKSAYNSVLNRPMSGIKKATDIIDVASNEAQIHMSANIRRQMSQKLEMINMALEAIEDGSYGTCRITGAPIPEKRLRAVPWALTAINAAA